jgi:hypothetical protein
LRIASACSPLGGLALDLGAAEVPIEVVVHAELDVTDLDEMLFDERGERLLPPAW